MYTREIVNLHLKIGFQAVFTHVLLANSIHLKNKNKMIAKNDRWKMIGDLRIFDYENYYDRS